MGADLEAELTNLVAMWRHSLGWYEACWCIALGCGMVPGVEVSGPEMGLV